MRKCVFNSNDVKKQETSRYYDFSMQSSDRLSLGHHAERKHILVLEQSRCGRLTQIP